MTSQNEDQLLDEIATRIQELTDEGDDAPSPMELMERMAEWMAVHHPDVKDWMSLMSTAHLRLSFKCFEEARRAQEVIDSPVGQLMKENPKMTLSEAMKKLGYW